MTGIVINMCRMYQRLQRKCWLTLERVKSQRSLVVHWHSLETVTARAPLRLDEMRMENVFGLLSGNAGLHISGEVQCLHTGNTQIRPVGVDF